jgi:hypothetical protein
MTVKVEAVWQDSRELCGCGKVQGTHRNGQFPLLAQNKSWQEKLIFQFFAIFDPSSVSIPVIAGRYILTELSTAEPKFHAQVGQEFFSEPPDKLWVYCSDEVLGQTDDVLSHLTYCLQRGSQDGTNRNVTTYTNELRAD